MRVISEVSNNRLIIIIAVAIIFFGGASLFLIGNQEKETPEEKVFLEDGAEYSPFFSCPVQSCTDAIPVTNIDSYMGVGFRNISENFEIRAIIGGTYTTTFEGDEATVILTDKDGIEVTYRFKGNAQESGQVSKNEKIGSYSGKTIDIPESEETFALFLVVRDTRTGNIIPVGADVISSSLKIL